ncbi:MAG: hypothetical protein AAFX94_08415 [Myxococcota bacterium]
MRALACVLVMCGGCAHYSAQQDLTPECRQDPKTCIPQCALMDYGPLTVDYSDGHPSRQLGSNTVEPGGGDFAVCREPD